ASGMASRVSMSTGDGAISTGDASAGWSASTTGAGGIATGAGRRVTAEGASVEILAAGLGSDVAKSLLGANCRLTATDAEIVNVSIPAHSRVSGPHSPRS